MNHADRITFTYSPPNPQFSSGKSKPQGAADASESDPTDYGWELTNIERVEPAYPTRT
jgi:hypothetical protein